MLKKRKNQLIIVTILLVLILVKFRLINIDYSDIISMVPLPNYIKNILRLFSKINPINNQDNSKESTNNDIHKNTSKKKTQINNRKVSALQKKVVASNQKWKCNKCKNILNFDYEIDHITPLYKKGTNKLDNLQALCRNCHGIKTVYDRIN